MNSRLDIITACLDQGDWSPSTSTDFMAMMARFVNRAYRMLGNDAPFLITDVVRISTMADVFSTSSDDTDRLAVDASDVYVLSRVTNTDNPWTFDGSWDGRWLEITNGNGDLVQVQSRKWWQSGGNDLVSLARPWVNNTDEDLTYRIYTPSYPLPGNAIEIKNIEFHGDSNRQVTPVTRDYIEENGLVDYRGNVTGQPELAYRGLPVKLPTPLTAATVAAGGSSWAGPDNAGKFDYYWTICYGRMPAEYRTAQNFVKPLWESAPSPVSATITVADDGTDITVTTPNIDKEYGFDVTGTTRENKLGFYKRIYARRYTSDTTTITDVIQAPTIAMLLGECAGGTESFTHDGSAFLDPTERMKNIHNYQTLCLFPVPDGKYSLDVRIQVAPQNLDNDYDTPQIPEDALDVLVYKTLEFLYEHDGAQDMVLRSQQEYAKLLRTLKKRYGSITFQVEHRRAARVRRGIAGAMRSRAVSYSEPTT